MEDQTCELCGRPIPVDPAARTLVKCPACSALLVPAEAVRISLLVRSGDSRPREATAIELPDEFRRRYRLERVLGVGAMGTVFKAVQLSMDRLVAVKVLIRREEPRALDRFLREGQVLAALRHPNLVQVYDLDVLDGCPYLVTEYLDGGTLATRLKTRGRFEPAEAGRIVLECLAALDACHQAGFVHRDLKPENIMFAADARAKIVDFGMATILSSPRDLTQAGSVIGTPRYMAPEQILGKAVDARTDLYALGTILFEMIAGRPPFTASSVREVFQMHLFKPPPGLSELVHGVPDRLVELVERSLAKEPDQRPASAEAFGEELRRALGETVQDPRTARGPGDPGEQAVKRPAALKTPRVPRAPRAPGEGSSAARAPRPGRGLALGALLGLVAAVAATVQLARTGATDRPGTGASSTGPEVVQIHLPPQGDPEEIVTRCQLAFVDRDHVRVDLDCSADVTPGIQVDGRDDRRVHWSDHRGKGGHRLTVPLPDRNSRFSSRIVFREVRTGSAGGAGGRSSRLRVPLVGIEAVRSRFLERGRQLRSWELHPLLMELVDLSTRGDGKPTRHQVLSGEAARQATPVTRQALARGARRAVAEWIQARYDLELDLLLTALPVLLARDAGPVADRYEVYETLARHSGIDAAFELVTGAPLLDVDRLAAGLVAVSRGGTLPEAGCRPLAWIERPATRKVLRQSHLGFFTLLTSPIALWGQEPCELYLDAVRRLAVADRDDPAREEVWYWLGELPMELALADRLRVGVRVAGLASQYRLWIRLGEKRRMLFRNPAHEAGAVLNCTSLPGRRLLEQVSRVISVEVPSGFVDPRDRGIALKLEVFSSTKASPREPARHGCFVIDLVVGKP